MNCIYCKNQIYFNFELEKWLKNINHSSFCSSSPNTNHAPNYSIKEKVKKYKSVGREHPKEGTFSKGMADSVLQMHEVTSIDFSKLNVRHGDLLIFSSSKPIYESTKEYITKFMKANYPDVNVLFVHKDIEVSAVSMHKEVKRTVCSECDDWPCRCLELYSFYPQGSDGIPDGSVCYLCGEPGSLVPFHEKLFHRLFHVDCLRKWRGVEKRT